MYKIRRARNWIWNHQCGGAGNFIISHEMSPVWFKYSFPFEQQFDELLVSSAFLSSPVRAYIHGSIIVYTLLYCVVVLRSWPSDSQDRSSPKLIWWAGVSWRLINSWLQPDKCPSRLVSLQSPWKQSISSLSAFHCSFPQPHKWWHFYYGHPSICIRYLIVDRFSLQFANPLNNKHGTLKFSGTLNLSRGCSTLSPTIQWASPWLLISHSGCTPEYHEDLKRSALCAYRGNAVPICNNLTNILLLERVSYDVIKFFHTMIVDGDHRNVYFENGLLYSANTITKQSSNTAA